MISALPDRSAPLGRGAFRTALIVLGLVLLSTGIRFYRIAAWSFWSDEISTLRDAQNLRDVIGYPVGYFLIGRTVNLVGETEFGARLLPAIFGIAGCVLLFFMGRRLFSERTGAIAAVLLALCSFHVYYSQYARYYTMLALFSMAGTWAAFEGFERNRRSWVAGGAGLLALACWTHWTAGLLVAALVVYLLWSARGDRPRGLNRWNIIILFAPFLLGGIAFFPDILKLMGDWGEGSFSFRRAFLIVLKLVDRMEPAALLCAFPAAWFLAATKDRRGKWLLTYAVVPSVILVGFVGFAHGGSRFAFVALPAVMLLAGAGLDLLFRYSRGRRRVAAAALVGLACLSLGVRTGLYFGPEHGQRPRWKEAISRALDQGGANRIYATTPAIFNHYAERWGSSVRAEPLENAFKHGEQDNAPRLLVVEQVANVAPSAEQLEKIEAEYRLIERYAARVRLLNYSIEVYSEKLPP